MKNDKTKERNRPEQAIPPPFARTDCPNCHSRNAAYKTIFDDTGKDWQLVCFECGQVRVDSPAGKTVRQLRHKCRVRYRLG
ncbi:MAG: hypothetical protein ACPIA8_02955 [Candidatus Puniceispirillaceae bacterium]